MVKEKSLLQKEIKILTHIRGTKGILYSNYIKKGFA
jgi:hypothetical protein